MSLITFSYSPEMTASPRLRLTAGTVAMQMLAVVNHFFDSGQVDHMFSSELPSVAVHITLHAAYPAHGKPS
jgi:hypothetical protein